MVTIRITDVTDEASFRFIPPCADPGFDHRSCDYWEDAERGSRAARPAWLRAGGSASQSPARQRPANPFLDEAQDAGAPPIGNPFARLSPAPAFNPFSATDGPLADNPFAPRREARPTVAPGAPRKLALLARGLAIFGTYAKVALADEEAVVYAQFGPLSAYPRAQRLRDLYPQLPAAPLPAVITCIAATAGARRHGYARLLVEAVCEDLAGRGFAAVEAYPELGTRPDATSAATPEFWTAVGFRLAVDDERFPVVRRELD